MKDVVSVIIPIYNTEEYLRDCIDSVLHLNYQHTEIILVNDGSKDGSLDICREYAQKDSRIVLIDKENEGVSVARNTGIARATGEWVTFLDSDDMLFADAFDILDSEESVDCDVVCFGLTRSDASTRVNTDKKMVLSNREMQLSILRPPYFYKKYPDQKTLTIFNTWSSCCRLYRRAVLTDHNISYVKELKLGEDLHFCFNLYQYVDKVTLCAKDIYYYRWNPSSATSGFRADNLKNTLCLLDEVNRYVVPEQRTDFLYFVLDRVIDCVKRYYCHPNCTFKRSVKKKELKELCEMPLVKAAVAECGYRYLSSGIKTRIVYKAMLFAMKKKCYGLALLLGKI